MAFLHVAKTFREALCRKNFAKYLADWKSCSTFALATQKNGVSEVSEPHE